MLKFFMALILCLNNVLYAEEYLPENAFWKYKYENQDHNGNIVHKGSVVFTVKNIDNTFYEWVSFDETGLSQRRKKTLSLQPANSPPQ